MRAVRLGLVAPAVVAALFATARPRVAADEISDAKAVWEDAIRAKGGRERLRDIRNFVTSEEETFAHSPRPDVISHEYLESLYVIPTRYWQYEDYRPGKMGENGLALDMNRHRVLNNPDRSSAQGLYDDLVYRLRNAQVVYLMETEYVQPKPVALKIGRFKRADVDIVETRLDTDRIEFSFDRRTHLPVGIVIQEERLQFPDIYSLSNYKTVDGIEMPMNVHLGDDGTRTPTTYRFNVEYDEAVFHQGSVRFERNGWMKR